MNKIYFATSNKDKLAEARGILTDIEIESIDLQIDEIQSLDSVEVATKKARMYYEKIKQPLFVDDSAIVFEVLNKLPGPYAGDFIKALGLDGLLALIANKDNRNAVAKSIIVYIDKNSLEHVFVGESPGKITTEPRGTNGFGWDAIFIPNGYEKTYSEMTNEEKNGCSTRQKALRELAVFLKS